MSIEASITKLVQSAPAIDARDVDELVEALREHGSPLALSIARVVELVAEGLVDAGIALPPLAMACATLANVALGDREREAARFEIETLMPVPDRQKLVVPDVPLSSLAQRRRT